MNNFNDVISGVDEVLNSAKHGNFEEVLSKTKNYAEKATKKSAERLEISRKKIELLDSKTKLAKAYEKFGKLSFDKREGTEVSEDDINSCLAEIQLQKTRAEMLDAEIEELRVLFAEPMNKREARKEAKRTKTEEAEAPVVEVEVVNPEE